VHIHRKSRTASFKQTAKGATQYFCELYHCRHLKFADKCGSKEVYANRLPKGSYTYEVWGLDNHGRSPEPAFRRFKLGRRLRPAMVLGVDGNPPGFEVGEACPTYESGWVHAAGCS
jgi:hypothetical protein